MTNAIVSLLYDTGYLPGALVLGISIRKILAATQKKAVLGLIIDSSKFNHHQLGLLQQIYDELIEATVFTSTLVDKLAHDLKRPELDKTFTKIQLWGLSAYDKVLYLDCDTLPSVPAPGTGAGSVVDLLDLDFGPNKILAAPDSGFPDIFNSGVFVLKPNATDFANLVSLVSSGDAAVSFDGADQGLLNQYFNPQPDWVADLLAAGHADVGSAHRTTSSNWVHIPFFYNTTPSAQYEYLPAYNHFSAPGPGRSQFPGPHGGVDSDADVSSQLYPTYATLDRYHASALTFFAGDQSLIKLVHFIGPAKPWAAGLSGGIFAPWWDVWNEYFYGKSVSDLVYARSDISIPFITNSPGPAHHEEPEPVPEPAPAPAPEPAPEPEPQPEPEPELKLTEPADLCDPRNYQHIPESQVSSDGSNWDATREPPPVEQEVHHVHQDFAEEMRSFSNVWDEPQPEPQYETPPPPPAPEPHVDTFEFGYHYDQPVERVFNDESDYVPSHLLILQKEVEKDNQSEVDEELSKGATSVPSEYQITTAGLDSISFNKVNERLEKLALISNKHEVEEIFDDEDDDEDDIMASTAVSSAPKLFPWEFRNDKPPERVFD